MKPRINSSIDMFRSFPWHRLFQNFLSTPIILPPISYSLLPGIEALGPPGNLEKGVTAALDYTANVLQIKNLSIAEGSGISRRNKVSAHHMLRILDKFKPHHQLMRKKRARVL